MAEKTTTPLEGERTIEDELKALKEQNLKLSEIIDNKNFNPIDQLLDGLVKEVLGNKFEWRVLGLGQFQTLELELPDELAHPNTSYEKNVITEEVLLKDAEGNIKRDANGNAIKTGEVIEKDGRLKFYKTHPKAGQRCGDVRHCRIKDEIQIKQWLLMIKNEIIKRMQEEGKTVEF